jgi:hypothetical protein
MKSRFYQVLWIGAVLALSAIVLSRLEQWELERAADTDTAPKRTALVMLVGLSGENFPGSESGDSYTKVGCDDALIAYEIPVVTARLVSVLNALSEFDPPEGLHNPMKEKRLQVTEVDERPRGMVVVELAGNPQIGGNCDAPRLKGQIEETIQLYAEKSEIRLNGTREKYDCMANVYGRCS